MPPEDLHEDGGAEALPADLVLYIKTLDDSVSNYQRFFDSLLVQRSDHDRLFDDLRHFREQEHITRLLTTKESEELNLKELYRQCTREFLASRFAHPWCRNEYGKTKSGFFDTASGRQKRQEAQQKEEDRFHKLLVPIWNPFRRRMMPTEEELAAFLATYADAEQRRREEMLQRNTQEAPGIRLSSQAAPEAGQTCSNYAADTTTTTTPGYSNAEAFVSEEDDTLQNNAPQNNGSQQAANLFIGVAAASFLASNKRARNYLMRKMKK